MIHREVTPRSFLKVMLFLVIVSMSSLVGAFGVGAVTGLMLHRLVSAGLIAIDFALGLKVALAAGVILGLGPFGWMASTALRVTWFSRSIEESQLTTAVDPPHHP